MKVKIDYVLALVVHNQLCKIPETIFPHQVQILEGIYSDVQVLDVKPPVTNATFDTAEEYARLQSIYGDAIVKGIWRDLAEFDAHLARYEVKEEDELAALQKTAEEMGIEVDGRWNVKRLTKEIDAAKSSNQVS